MNAFSDAPNDAFQRGDQDLQVNSGRTLDFLVQDTILMRPPNSIIQPPKKPSRKLAGLLGRLQLIKINTAATKVYDFAYL